jgi:hypothetical protein
VGGKVTAAGLATVAVAVVVAVTVAVAVAMNVVMMVPTCWSHARLTTQRSSVNGPNSDQASDEPVHTKTKPR